MFVQQALTLPVYSGLYSGIVHMYIQVVGNGICGYNGMESKLLWLMH